MNLKLIDMLLNPLSNRKWKESKIILDILKKHGLKENEAKKVLNSLLEINVIEINEKNEVKMTKLGKKILKLNNH